MSLVATSSCATAGIGGRRGLSQLSEGAQPQLIITDPVPEQQVAVINGALVPVQAATPETQQGAQDAQYQGVASPGTTSPQAVPAAAGDAGAAFGGGGDILALHNQYRATHNAPPLSWSAALVSSAQDWANGLAGSCGFYHSGTQGLGENLAAGYTSWSEVASTWYQEINSYNFANPGFSEATGHAMQMLWVATREVGCAVAATPSGCWERNVYVCHYSPPGNVMGQFQQNVL
ncbi:hypothetical protein PLESTF_001296700 [Pleodorina starrii]|nr:hypothetical protein PLESTM_001473400 [Pleodorina starrii]GLC72820.1 hypothetical protein PLESTF_001296700 [Pleodorina starrii]